MRNCQINPKLPILLLSMLAAVLALPLGGCDGQRTVRDSDINFIGLPGVQDLITRQRAKPDSRVLLFVDPRPESAYSKGHLPGARQLRLSQVVIGAGRDPAISRYEHIIVYGDHPADAPARAMAKRLMSQKYKGVRLYDGGLIEWKARGMPVSTPDDMPGQPGSGG